MYKMLFISIAMMLSIASCNTRSQKNMGEKQATDTTDAIVDIKTTMGDIRVRLYGDTPKHRDNFLKLGNENFYDSTLFHRVIDQFMIQAGDPDSKNVPADKMLGAGGPGYTIEAEFVYPKHFHKRGALAAARQGDQVNPMKNSSGSQFYIVTGRIFDENDIQKMEENLQNERKQTILNNLVIQNQDTIILLQSNYDQEGLQALVNKLIAQTEEEVAKSPAKFTNEQKQAYMTVGGAPSLDGDYTVFGEVISGMDVVEKIEKTPTDPMARPTEDVMIISMKEVK